MIFIARFQTLRLIKLNMVNIEPSDFQKFMRILTMFVGIYAITFGFFLGTDKPELKKQK